MATFQAGPSILPGISGIQIGAQPAQQPTMTNISMQTAPQQAQQRQLTAESIRRHYDSASRDGRQNDYWQVAKPGRTLKLSGALAYVARPGSQYYGRQGNQRFVYWPQWRVAGTVQDIVQNFRASGDPQFTNLTEQQVLANAIDPLNPAHAQALQNLSAQSGEGAGAGARRPRHTVEEYIMIAQAIKAASKGATSAGGVAISGGRGGAGRGGSKDPMTARARLIQSFNELMQQASQLPPGQDLQTILNVSTFDPQRFTKAIRSKPSSGPRATMIRPSIVVQGRRIPVPIQAQPQGAANFEAFVNNIVGQSQFGQFAPQILQSFREQLSQRQSAGTGAVQNMMMPQQVLGLQQTLPTGFQAQSLPTGFQAQPAMSVMQQLQQQQLGSTSPGTPRSPGSSGAASPGTPRGLGAGAGFQIPTFGAQPGLQIGGGAPLPTGTQLPSVSLPGGVGLPTAGLPTIRQIQLPGTTMPTIPLPGQQ